jgi:hypothetical protein
MDKDSYSIAQALKAVTDKINEENNELSALLSYISNFLRIQFPSSYSPPST